MKNNLTDFRIEQHIGYGLKYDALILHERLYPNSNDSILDPICHKLLNYGTYAFVGDTLIGWANVHTWWNLLRIKGNEYFLDTIYDFYMKDCRNDKGKLIYDRILNHGYFATFGVYVKKEYRHLGIARKMIIRLAKITNLRFGKIQIYYQNKYPDSFSLLIGCSPKMKPIISKYFTCGIINCDGFGDWEKEYHRKVNPDILPTDILEKLCKLDTTDKKLLAYYLLNRKTSTT